MITHEYRNEYGSRLLVVEDDGVARWRTLDPDADQSEVKRALRSIARLIELHRERTQSWRQLPLL